MHMQMILNKWDAIQPCNGYNNYSKFYMTEMLLVTYNGVVYLVEYQNILKILEEIKSTKVKEPLGRRKADQKKRRAQPS